jgi:hypothetical protein
MKRLFLFAALLASASLALGQQFKWVDKDGRVQYGDSPPPGAKATRLKPPPAGTPTATSTSPAAKDGKKGKPLTPEEAFQKRQQEAKEKQEKAAKEQADAATKKENCARAQEHLRGLQSGQRQARVDARGERVILDDAEIARETAKTQELVRQACSG